MQNTNRIVLIIFIAILVLSGIPLIKVLSRHRAGRPMQAMKKILYQTEEVNSKADIRLAKPEELNQPNIFDKRKKQKDTENAQDYPVEVFGPPSERTVVTAYLPVYPEWVKNKGERVEVVLWFHVLPRGTIKDDISVSRSCGYPELDKLAIKALGEWIFLPSDGEEEQWGQINFRYNP